MADIIKYLRIPFPRFPLVKDASDDWNPVRGDYNGGVFAGPFGSFYERWQERAVTTSTGGGSTVVTTTAVSSGYVYVLQQIDLYHTEGTARSTLVGVMLTEQVVIAQNLSGITGYEHLTATGEWLLVEGDVVRGAVTALSSGYDAVLRVWGYKVRL